jgi:putative transposase
MSSPRIFRYFKTSPEIIRLAVMMYVRYPLSLRNVEDLLHECGIDITYETVRFWWNRFGTIFAAESRRNRVQAMRHFQHRRWHLDEVFVKINGVKHYLWRAVDHEGEVLESFVTKRRDKKAALRFLRKSLRRNGQTESIVTDRLASYGAALKQLGALGKRVTGRWLNNRAENSHQPFRRRERAMVRFRRMRSLQKFAAVHGSIHNQFASRPLGSTGNAPSLHEPFSRIAAPPLSPSGVNSARPDHCRGRGLSETFLVCLTAPPATPSNCLCSDLAPASGGNGVAICAQSVPGGR